MANPSHFMRSKKDDLRPIGDKILDLNVSQSELLGRLQIMKQDLQDWRTKLDTQVKTYKEELTVLNKELNSDLEQLKSGLQQLRVTLQQQQDHISDNLKNLGLEDGPEGSEVQETEVKEHPISEREVPLLDKRSDAGSEGVIADTSA
ncbi:hypothetical protein HPP92_017216 [Vanilla planifolia]|uniref:Uncharacterized protein n=1 Tax=Vanilla planifolia TaxID=51239 RepID=A0A835USX0_VANPL|nr:hypothetical protein HPP92_017216 [Vanilla planifolia]